MGAAVERRDLTIRLEGPPQMGGLADFADFARLCDTIRDCLRRCELAIGDDVPRLYPVTHLDISSAIVRFGETIPDAAAVEEALEPAIGVLADTVTGIQTAGQPDPRLGYNDLLAFKKLVRPIGKRGHSQALRLNDTRLTREFPRNINRFLKRMTRAKGSVTGMIRGLNVNNTRVFRLYRPGRPQPVICEFPDGLLDKVKDGVMQTVTVEGLVYYGPDTGLPQRVRATEIDIHEPDDTLPTMESLRGLLGKDALGGKSAGDFVRNLRDEWDKAD